ncbi:hypothetical protein [Lacticaseibacillus songhuajiangensis]|jgi:Flp pilus assembly protein TadB|uniref:hypothetical protein n=1 Tax=Lacticaseibacillus songhuajiangensis TaxID=1296539 RepID=UPI000F77DE8B|nr:hypothetical protein [Lacticaseibacillus songhuajiangensis]MCI1283111.1 hypothetical protein [Lacticaseibacillus songhuajiangensis]
MNEPKTRREAREQRAAQEEAARNRDKKRVDVEREYARSEAKHPEKLQRFDEQTYRKVNGLKQKLNWAIGITIVLIILVAVVLFVF